MIDDLSSRQDSACLPFLTLCQGILEDPATNIYLVSTASPLISLHQTDPKFAKSTGIFQTICEIVKVSSPSTLLSVWDTLYRFLFICDAVAATRKGSLMGKFRAKLAGRLALLRLPASMPGTIEDMIVPDEVELIVQDLLEAVENKASRFFSLRFAVLTTLHYRTPSFVGQPRSISLVSPNGSPIHSLTKSSKRFWGSSRTNLSSMDRRTRRSFLSILGMVHVCLWLSWRGEGRFRSI